jgi:DNA repair protein RecN (Recombination protein N)
MLTNIHVKNLALIDEIEIDFKPGLNILTGETGAGKSILLGSINLALGGRYSAEMLRVGAPYGLVELSFLVDDEKLHQELINRDIYPEEGCVVLSRRLMEGRSVSKINGETVNIGQLQEIADLLINIHGQHEHQILRSKKQHLNLLDDYGSKSISQLKNQVATLYKEYISCKKAYEELDLDEASRKKEMSFLEFEIKEIEEANIVPGEDQVLEDNYRRMSEGKKLIDNTKSAYYYTSSSGEGNASEYLSRAINALAQVAGFDDRGAQLYQQVVELDSLLNDFNRELSDYEKSLEFSEEELHNTEIRLNQINQLKSKYGQTTSLMLSYLEDCKEKLERLANYEEHLNQLHKKMEESESRLKEVSEKITAVRKKVAVQFTKEIVAGLQDLNFPKVQLEIKIDTLKGYTAEGVDDVEFYISTNPGEPLKPLSTVASGGELSRIMLVLKSLLADKDETGTLIFDEIDTGISGVTAGKVAGKLKLIGDKCQVICITHLPQIAAKADAHYLIEKHAYNNKTITEIRCLEEEDSVVELARILGGDNVTESVIATAREMKVYT